MQKLEALIEHVTSCDRLVPRGTDWFELYLLGVNYLQLISDADFPKPLKWDSPLKKKRDRLIKQIEFAHKYDFLEPMDNFLRDPKLKWEKESIEGTRGRDKDSEILIKINSYKDKDEKLFSLLNYVTSDNKVFPVKWSNFSQWGVEKQKELKIAERFPPPLILAVYHFTTEKDKQLRLIEQIEYANNNGFIEEVEEKLRELRKDEWIYKEETLHDEDEINISEFHKLRKEKLFEQNSTKLISSFSKIRELEKTSEIYFNKENMFCIYIERLYNIFSVGSYCLKSLIEKIEHELVDLKYFVRDSENNPDETTELEKLDYIHTSNSTELLLSKLQIIQVMYLMECKDPDWFGSKLWDLLVDKHICQEDFSSEG